MASQNIVKFRYKNVVNYRQFFLKAGEILCRNLLIFFRNTSEKTGDLSRSLPKKKLLIFGDFIEVFFFARVPEGSGFRAVKLLD